MSYHPDLDKKDGYSASQEKADQLPVLEAGEYGSDPHAANAFEQRKDEHLAPALKPRHLAMISIGGVIGTGLFLGTGKSLHNAGPLGLLLGYMLIGTVCYGMMMCLGEMISFLPLPGGHIALANRFVGRPLGFALGWNFWFNYVWTLPAELTAGAVLVSYWSDLNSGIWIAIFIVLVTVINLLGARAYGEAEFWFASIKVLTITGLIILSFCIDLGAGNQGRLGFQYWKNPGVFVQYADIPGSWGQFLGFFSVLVQAAFSYIGTEIVGIAAAEAKNPRKTVPSAIKKVWIRILVFYILGTFCVGLICPSNAADIVNGQNKTDRSAFVIAIKLAGIKGLPSVINACLITSAVSAGSSDMYSSSRALYGLAIGGSAPRMFAKTTKSGLPWVSVLVSIAFSLLAFMSLSTSASTVFGWFANMTSIAGLASWTIICVTYLRFNKGMAVQGIDRAAVLPFRASGTKYLAMWSIFWCFIAIFFSGWTTFLSANAPFDVADFVTNYIPLAIFVVLFSGAIIKFGMSSFKRAEDMDFVSGIQEIIDAETEDDEPKNAWEKFWNFIS